MPHPAYSPDPAPCDFGFSPNLRIALRANAKVVMRKWKQQFGNGVASSHHNSSPTAWKTLFRVGASVFSDEQKQDQDRSGLGLGRGLAHPVLVLVLHRYPWSWSCAPSLDLGLGLVIVYLHVSVQNRTTEVQFRFNMNNFTNILLFYF